MSPDQYWNLIISASLAVGVIGLNIWYIRSKKK